MSTHATLFQLVSEAAHPEIPQLHAALVTGRCGNELILSDLLTTNPEPEI